MLRAGRERDDAVRTSPRCACTRQGGRRGERGREEKIDNNNRVEEEEDRSRSAFAQHSEQRQLPAARSSARKSPDLTVLEEAYIMALVKSIRRVL
mmetsp:Transcript_57644/g.126300  ORF Transcript_57644/g.126300 Transcript_57644/m.126300 type:complete len:95 (-) Transcript_57644:854-1138(-)